MAPVARNDATRHSVQVTLSIDLIALLGFLSALNLLYIGILTNVMPLLARLGPAQPLHDR